MSKTIKTLAALTTLAAAAGLAYAQNGVNTPASAQPQNASQGAIIDNTGTTSSPSSSQNVYRSPTTVNSTEQVPSVNSSTAPQGAMGNTDANTMNSSSSTLNNANSSNVNNADATLTTDPVNTSRPARADRN